MPVLSHCAADSPTEDILAVLVRDGGLILDNFLYPEVAAGLASDFKKKLEREPWNNTENQLPDSFFGYQTKRLHGLVGLSEHFESVLTDKRVLQIADKLLGSTCNALIMSTSELMAIGRGEQAQSLHRDADSWGKMPRSQPEILLSINVALTPFTSENGATVVIPGSHKWERGREIQENEKAYAVMDAGSAFMYTGSVMHGGGANSTDETRIGMYVGYIPNWLRPLENSHATVPETCLKDLSKEAQVLLGYSEAGFIVYF